jgi:hypothetical protein
MTAAANAVAQPRRVGSLRFVRRGPFVRFEKIVYDDLSLPNLLAFDTVTVFNRRVQNHTQTAHRLNANFANACWDG